MSLMTGSLWAVLLTVIWFTALTDRTGTIFYLSPTEVVMGSSASVPKSCLQAAQSAAVHSFVKHVIE